MKRLLMNVCIIDKENFTKNKKKTKNEKKYITNIQQLICQNKLKKSKKKKTKKQKI